MFLALDCVSYQRIMVLGVSTQFSKASFILIAKISVVESRNKQFSLTPYLFPCREAILQAVYEGLGKEYVLNLTVKHLPNFNIILNDTLAIVDIKNEDFESCQDLKYELQCQVNESDIFTSVVNFTQQTVSVEEYQGMECRVR